jgi:hypothetical protein
MIVLRSLVLSFSVFWRLLIVMPVVIPITMVVAFAFSLVFFPLANLFVTIAQVFIGMIGIRAGMQALGAWNPPSLEKLILTSLKWGLLCFVLGLMIGIVAGVTVFALEGEGAWRQLQSALLANSGNLWWTLATSGTPLGWIVVGTIALIYAIGAALMVPMAASAHAASEKAQRLDVFWSFGASFPAMLVVLIGSAAVAAACGALFLSHAVVQDALIAAAAWLDGASPAAVPVDAMLRIAALLLVELWTYAWIFAAASLAFVRRRDEAAADSAVVPAPPAAAASGIAARAPAGPETPSAVDVRALRKSREQS